MILGYALTFLLGGCASTGGVWPESAPTPVGSALRGHHPARAAAETELGPEAAEALPPIDHTPPRPPDPGAEALVQALLGGMEHRPVGEDGTTVVDLARLRNHSHAAAAEFSSFRQRLTEVLNRAGEEAGVRFTAEAGDAHYRLDGTAYLVTADGFDQWELYLRLSPADAAWTLWQSSRPIRVLRHARPGQPQFTAAPGGSPEADQSTP
ncbi:MAG: hypothetical protein JSV91_01995 [Phycisphaerales bacterium]|nr:MAG: hypothetical protein JSV91_01995 [Phycisphaerales bacterium]